MREKQVYDVELGNAKVAESKSRVAVANLEKNAQIAQRRLAVVLHRSRLLVTQDREPLPIDLDASYAFDLDDPDVVDLALIPDFPGSREEAIELAKRQRVDVRILVVGLRIAQLRSQGTRLRLLGTGGIPAELSFKNTTEANHGVALGAIFGATFSPPLVDIGLWSSIRAARLDVIQSQLDLKKSLLDVAQDAGNTWDRWQQAVKEWGQREAELELQREILEREERLYGQKQSIRLDVLGAQVDMVQADANRWTAWYNLQLARLDILRATELLLDYVERAGIAHLPAEPQSLAQGQRKRWFTWLTQGRLAGLLTTNKEETPHGGSEKEGPLASALGPDPGAHRGRGPVGRAVPAAADSRPAADQGLVRANGSGVLGDPAARHDGQGANSPGASVRRPEPGRAIAQQPSADPAGRPVPRRTDLPGRNPSSPGGGNDRDGDTPR